MSRRQRVYLDDMALTYFSGAKSFKWRGVQSDSLETLRVAVLSGEVMLIASFVHAGNLRKYRNRGKRGRMNHVLGHAAKFIKRTRQIDALAQLIRKTGLGIRDAYHAAAAKSADALMLTQDKELLHLAHKHRALFGVVRKVWNWRERQDANEEE